MRCPSCNAVSANGVAFCARCGASFSVAVEVVEPAPTPEAPTWERRWQPSKWPTEQVPAPAPQPNYGSWGAAPQFPRAMESRSYSAPSSFVGSTSRITAWASHQEGAMQVLAVLVCIVALPLVWLFVLCWYIVVFGLFGVFTFPFRLMRRSSRRSQHLQEAQLATMQQMLWQQTQQRR